MMKIDIFVFTTFSVSSVLGLISLKKCPCVAVKEDFNIAQFQGNWFMSYNLNTLQELQSSLTTREEPSKMVIHQSGDRSFHMSIYVPVLLITVNLEGTATQNYGCTNGSFSSTLGMKFLPKFNFPLDIVDTDYTNYAIIINCVNRYPGSIIDAWILTRKFLPDDKVIKNAIKILEPITKAL